MAGPTVRVEVGRRRTEFASIAQDRTASLPADECTTESVLDGFLWASRAAVTIRSGWDGIGNIGGILGGIAPEISTLRIVATDESLREFILEEIRDTSGGDGRVRLTGRGILHDLTYRKELIFVATGGAPNYTITKRDTVSNLITFALGFNSDFVLGTITPTATIEVTASYATPMAWLLAVAEATQMATGVAYEYWEEWDPASTKYKLHFGVRNTSTSVVNLFFGKNLLGVERLTSGKGRATRLCPVDTVGRGAGPNHWLVVTVPDGTHIEIEDVTGRGQPLLFDSSLDNSHWVIDTSGAAHAITGGLILSATRCRLTMASSAGISVGHLVRLSDTSAGDEVRFVKFQNDDGQLRMLPLRVKMPGVTNFLTNADLSAGATDPTSWNKAGFGTSAFDTTPANWQVGGRSVKLTAGPTVTFDQSYTYQVPATGVWYANYAALIKIDPSSTAATTEFSAYYAGALIAGSPKDLNLFADGQFHVIHQAYPMTSGSRTLKLEVKLGRVPMWWNGGMIYVTEGSPVEVPFFVGSGGACNWLECKQYLDAHRLDRDVNYQVRVTDVNRLDVAQFPYDELLEGRTVKVYDEILGIAPSVRIVQIDRDERRHTMTTLRLNTALPTLTGALADG